MPNKSKSKGQALEHMKPTKKLLKTEYRHGNLDTTIGDLTIDQLRIALWRELKEKEEALALIDRIELTITKFYFGS